MTPREKEAAIAKAIHDWGQGDLNLGILMTKLCERLNDFDTEYNLSPIDVSLDDF